MTHAFRAIARTAHPALPMTRLFAAVTLAAMASVPAMAEPRLYYPGVTSGSTASIPAATPAPAGVRYPAGTEAATAGLAHASGVGAVARVPLTIPPVATLPVAPTPPVNAIPPAFVRWQGSLAAFAKADVERYPANDGVLFVGSSTIRMWTNLQQDFRQVPVVINRGFGGSTMADCDFFARELVTQYKPKQVMVYAGDNDLAEGRTPAQVLDSFAHFVRSVRAELPHVQISYISIKPSPSRLALMPKIRETNNLISSYVQGVSNMRYIDIFTPMLAADGLPRGELFLGDRLHMNDAGYQLWQSVIAAHMPGNVPAVAAPQLAGAAPVNPTSATVPLPQVAGIARP